MALPRQTTQWAVDTNFLLHLADEKEQISLAWESALKKNIGLFATRTVLEELDYLSRLGPNAEARTQAFKALSNLRRVWKIDPLGLSDIEIVIARSFAADLLNNRLIPEAEKNDALVLAEASVKNIPFLVTSDGHILQVDRDALILLCHSRDLPVVSILHPIAARRSLER